MNAPPQAVEWLFHRPREDQTQVLREERAYLFGVLVGTLSYGSLLILSTQLFQAFVTRPRRGQAFWILVAYSSFLFVLPTIAVGILWNSCDLLFINDEYNLAPWQDLRVEYSKRRATFIGAVSVNLLPWVADILMFFRLLVLSRSKWWIIIFPALSYLSKTVMSVVLLVFRTEKVDFNSSLTSRASTFGVSYHALTVSFNLYMTFVICYLALSMRKRLEAVSGRLHASFYTSFTTLFVESGAFFTTWITIYLILRLSNNVTQNIFFEGNVYCLSITRILIVLRMAQDRAWSKDMVVASKRGVLEWKVSSSHSLPLHDTSSQGCSTVSINKNDPEDAISLSDR